MLKVGGDFAMRLVIYARKQVMIFGIELLEQAVKCPEF